MRTTVGPLPPAVYWRRRAVVLGAVLLGIIVLFVSCSGDDSDPRGTGAPASQYPTPAPDTSAPETEPTFLDEVPGGSNPSLPAPGDVSSNGGDDSGSAPTLPGTGTGTGQDANVTAQADGACADQEMSVVPSAAARSVKRGTAVELTLTVKNVGTRTCSRDVGAGPQELYLDMGARNYWSSDKCSTDKSSDVRRFNPGDQRIYKITWNGRQSSSCSGNQASGPAPPPGQFELRARLGTKVSEPVTLTFVE